VLSGVTLNGQWTRPLTFENTFYREHILMQWTRPLTFENTFYREHILMQWTRPLTFENTFYREHILMQLTRPLTFQNSLPRCPGISGTFFPKANAFCLLLILLQPLFERVGLTSHTGHNGARFSQYRQAMRVGGAAVDAYGGQKF
jgi:hypothetical protein